MPSYYVHLAFDQRVLADLPTSLSEFTEQERKAFDLGCLGPDPLFFYQPTRPNAVRREGIKMHRRSTLPAVECPRQAIEDGVPISTGYRASFLCHLALDSVCRGYVDDRAADGPTSHMTIEEKYDWILMKQDGLDAAEWFPLPSAPTNRAVWGTASQAFVHASLDQMRRAYRSMAFFSGFLTRSNGRITGKIVGTVSHMLPIPSAKGIALKETPHPSTQGSSADLDHLLKAAILETAERITAFFQAISAGTPVPRWFGRGFKDNLPPVPQRIH